MKNSKILLLVALLLFAGMSYAQTKEPQKDKTKSTSNLLDDQTNLYKDFLGDTASGMDMSEINGYLDLVEQSELDPEQKKQAVDFYNSYDAAEKSGQIDSLRQTLEKLLEEHDENPVEHNPGLR
jgi:hypothetical protein